MKRLAVVAVAILVAAIAPLPRPAVAQSETAVTVAGEGIFLGGAELYGVLLSGLQFGKGVVIGEDGSATGQFQTLLLGTSVLGEPQNIAAEGTATSGVVNVDGSVTFSGLSTVERGDGKTLTGVPFSVTVTTQGLQLIIGGTTLPAATVTEGSLTIQ